MVINWNFNDKEFKRAVKCVKKSISTTDNFFGNLYIGHLSFDLVLYDFDSYVELFADLYVGGKDTGYGYTTTNNLPYDYADGFCILTKDTVNNFNSFTKFKDYLINKAIDYVNHLKDNEIIKKMNEKSSFDWS